MINHLGNVLVTVSDKKIGHTTNGTTVDYFNADVVTANDYYPFGMQMPGRKYSQPNTNYRYGFNGQEKTPEIFEGSTTATYWEYGSRIGRRWNVDPLASEFPWQSPYTAMDNDPINKTDPTGMAAEKTNSPIYGTTGKFLGTDDQGLTGKAIVMKDSDFKQGMKHNDALKKDLAPKGGKDFLKAIPDRQNYTDFYNHYNDLSKRPDYDGYLTKGEADSWWKGKTGQPLFADQSKIDLLNISTKSFMNKQGSSFYNDFLLGTGVFNNTGRVYGTLLLTLQNPTTGIVHLGGKKYLDGYDYKMDGRVFRDFATWAGRPGGENNGKNFFIIGSGQATVPVIK